MRLTVLLCWWAGWQPIYRLEHVNAIARQLRHYLNRPFRIALLTDQDARGAEVDEIHELPPEPSGLKLLQKPNCFRRLSFFDPEYQSRFDADWLFSVDLDTLFLEDVTEDIEQAITHPYGLWMLRGRWAGQKRNARPYNGALQLIRCGSHADVYADFHPVQSPQEIQARKWVGSDQSWISIKAPDAPTLGPDKGYYFFQQYCEARALGCVPARVLSYAGRDKPWSKPVRFQAKDIHEEYMRWFDRESFAEKQVWV